MLLIVCNAGGFSKQRLVLESAERIQLALREHYGSSQQGSRPLFSRPALRLEPQFGGHRSSPPQQVLRLWADQLDTPLS